MCKNVIRTIRRALLVAILGGATVFTAPMAGCDMSEGVKDVSANTGRMSREELCRAAPVSAWWIRHCYNI